MRVLLVLALLVVTSPSRADEADPDRPVPVRVHATLEGSIAHLAVRYRLPVKGPTPGRQFDLALPTHGVVTDAFVTVDRQRHHLALDRKAHAREALTAIEQAPGGRPRPWAFLLSDEDERLTLQVDAAHDATITLELAVDTETCFVGDIRYAAVPIAWQRAKRGMTDPCSGAYSDPDIDDVAWIALPTQEASAKPFGEQRITTTGARIDVPHGHFARVELALAKQLTQVAPDLYTVFVLDGSRSVTWSEREAQTELIESYAQHAAGSHVQLVAYARTARVLLPTWVEAHGAPIAKMLAALDPLNGSNLDAGIAAASALLASVHGTRRIVVLSDQRVSARVAALDPLRSILPEGTLVHVVALGEHTANDLAGTIVRDDKIVFAALARATEGFAASAQMYDDKIDALALVRPIILEHVKLETPGWTEASIARAANECTTDLREGASCTWWGRAAMRAGGMKLSGLLWNHPVTRDISPTAQPQLVARLLSDTDDATLGDAAHEILEAAGALDREWSMIAVWGGTAGYADVVPGIGIGGYGCGCGGGSPDGARFSSGGASRMTRGTLQEQIERGVVACRVTEKVEIALELTLDEIVDVAVKANDPALRECVTEAVWAVPVVLEKQLPHQTQTVLLAP